MKPQFEATIVQHRDDAANDSTSSSRRGLFSAFVRRLDLLAAAAGFGNASRSRERPETSRTESGAALYNRAGLLAHGEALLASCRQHHRELTLVVLDCSDLLEARAIYGGATTRALVDRIVGKLTVLAGSHGLAARTGPAQFAVAMPMSRDRAVHAIERALGNPCRIELERGNSEIVLVPNLMVEPVPEAATLETLFVALCRGLARVSDEEKTRLRYLQRERERHSRPMATGPAPAQTQTAQPLRAPRAEPVFESVATTIQMPLTLRQHSGA